MLARCIDAAFGGALLALLRHDAGGMRPGLERDLQHLVGRRHFQVQRNGQRLGEPRNIVIGNMSPVFAQVRGNTVGARILRQDCGAHRIGIVPTTRVTHCGDVIDVDAEPKLAHASPLLPGLTALVLRRCGGSLSAGQA